jgi:hypothetical protein
MLTALALCRQLCEPYGHVRPEEASLSLRHRNPRCFDVAAVGIDTSKTYLLSRTLLLLFLL